MGEECSLEKRIASLVHSRFDALPTRSKPAVRPNGVREWIPLSGIVLVTGGNTQDERLTCVALATGAKCHSPSQMPKCRGSVLHDSHAEILALRAFNRWLLEECKSVLENSASLVDSDSERTKFNSPDGCDSLRGGAGSHFVHLRTKPSANPGQSLCWPPFKLRDDVKIWMYCTTAPCGDASMELCVAAQEDPTPWTLPASAPNAGEDSETARQNRLLDGRAYFSILGVVRRKPSRADAESTLSKSCSDKFALKQLTSILSFPASLLVAPTPNMYLAGLLLPEEEISLAACERAFGCGETGRLRPLNGRTWSNPAATDDEYPFSFRPFEVRALPTADFESLWAFGKPKNPDVKSTPGNVSAVWTAAPSSSQLLCRGGSGVNTGVSETLLNGVKQGYRISFPGPRKASAISRAKMWSLLYDIVHLLPQMAENGKVIEQGSDAGTQTYGFASLRDCVLLSPTYEALKRKSGADGLSESRNRVLKDTRAVLGNWIENRGDESWGLEVLVDSDVKKKRR